MIGHIFDIDVLITINSKPWIIDKNNPNTPLLKIEKSDFMLINNGTYKKQNNKIEYNDKIFYLPTKLYNQIKVIAKTKKINISDIVISMQEFLNKDLIEKLDYKINFDALSILKNKNEDIYLICSLNTERNYKSILDILLDKLSEENFLVKKIYYLNETFYNNIDSIIFKKGLINLQHLTGYEIKNEQFIDKQINKYNKLYFYDDDFNTLNLTKQINSFLNIILNKTEIGLKEVIKEDIKEDKPKFIANKVTNNKYNKYITAEILLENNFIKKFEDFK